MIASLLVLVAGVGAAVTHRDEPGPAPPSPAAVQPAPTAAGNARALPVLGENQGVLIPPPEFLVIDDARAGTGVLDLDDVVRIDASDPPVARARFTELGFTAARSRAWQSPTDALLVVSYSFADEQGAATYVGEAAALRRADPAVTPLPLAGVPGASAFRLDLPGDPTAVAFLARGTNAYLIGLVGPAAADPQAALLQRLAAGQYDAAL